MTDFMREYKITNKGQMPANFVPPPPMQKKKVTEREVSDNDDDEDDFHFAL